MKLELKKKVKTLASQWNTPAKGNYVPLKEVCAYSIGGMGLQFLAALAGYLAMTAGTFLTGAVYGLRPTDMQTITLMSTILTLIITPIRGMFIDNTRSKKGKYRPIIFWTALPSAIILIAMAFIPLDAAYNTKFALLATGTLVLNIFYNQLLFIAYSNLVQVISPNSSERAAIVSFSSIVYSMAPTLTGFLFPLIAEIMGSTMIEISVYRVAFPVFGILGLILCYFAYFGTKERIVGWDQISGADENADKKENKKKTNKVNVGFVEGMKLVLSSKNCWIQNISTWFAFARMAGGMCFNWLFVYNLQDNVIMSLLTTLMGTASLIGMVASPIIIKYIGKKNLVIGANFLFAAAWAVAAIFPSNPYLLFVMIYIGNIANSTSIITGPSVGADIIDAEQERTGKRLDGFIANFGILASIIGMATGYVVPYITESNGVITNYDVLFEQATRDNLIRILAIVSVLGAIATAVPYFFYDLTEKDTEVLLEDLEQKEANANYEAGKITQEEYDNRLAEIEQERINDLAKETKKLEKAKADLEAGKIKQAKYDALIKKTEKREAREKLEDERAEKETARLAEKQAEWARKREAREAVKAEKLAKKQANANNKGGDNQ